jgi:hypothetical protein
LSFGQSLTTTGTISGSPYPYSTTYTFLGLEDVAVPGGTLHAACKWSNRSNFGYGPSTILTWTSHQGELLKVGTAELQAGSKFNGAPVGQ